jgi:hypothetical protein
MVVVLTVPPVMMALQQVLPMIILEVEVALVIPTVLIPVPPLPLPLKV